MSWSRKSGALLIEFFMTLTVLTVGILSVYALFQLISFSGRTTTELDEARVSLDHVADLLRRSPFEEIYKTYDGTAIPVANLKDEDDKPAKVAIRCFVNELAIPPEFGPLVDIDGQGGLESPDCSTKYRILPVRLSLSYRSCRETVTQELYLVLEPGA